MTSARLVELPDFSIGEGAPLCIIAGPCVVETERLCLEIAQNMRSLCKQLGFNYIFKASYDKANRTRLDSERGPGVAEGLRILSKVRADLGIPILSDVHEPSQAAAAAIVCDVLQVPAFLCRQTDLLIACGETGKTVNVKKGQFLAPEDMRFSIAKVRSTGNHRVLVTERGTSFGYHNLVVDFRSLPIMRNLGVPVVFDVTHSLQMPSSEEGVSGGHREFAGPLMKAAIATGVDALFLEVHPRPEEALSDRATTLPLSEVRHLLEGAKAIHQAICSETFREVAP